MKNISNLQLSDWLTEAQTQEMLGCKTTKLWQLRSEGKIKFSKIGSKTFYKLSSILNYLEENTNN